MERRGKKKTKENHEVEEEEKMKDRLSHLPDSLLLHILSFLPNTMWAVRTSVLSKRWKFLWVSLPDLIFNGYGDKLEKFVGHVLSGRNNLPVFKVCFHSHGIDNSLVTTITNYSVSHDVQHFNINLRSKSLSILVPFFNRCRSLKTLELGKFMELQLLRGISLPTLTTLHLSFCSFSPIFDFESSHSIDPFVSLVNLKSLLLNCCGMDSMVSNFKISGPQLHSLTITQQWHCLLEGCKVEIDAPKLHSFNFIKSNPAEFSKLDFPLLEIAKIDAFLPYSKENWEKSHLDLINMFRGLYHAQSLNIFSNAIEVLMEFPGVLEAQPSPFARLKNLNVRSHSKSFNIPENVMNYFVSGSTFGKDIRIEIEENQRH